MALTDETTTEFSEMYDAFRADVLGLDGPVRLYDNDGALITNGSIDTGWTVKEVSEEHQAARSVELRITDRAGVAFATAVFFGLNSVKYERENFPSPPLRNPREWVWTLRPVGVDT
jgi:hypothetical protein